MSIENPVQVAIEPSGRLSFTISTTKADSASKATITLSNSTAGPRLAFKVKTTQPKRYLVRPNQGVINLGERKGVAIIIPVDKQAAIIQDANGQEGTTDKFQILLTGIETQLYEAINQMQDVKEQTDKLQRFWETVDKKSTSSRKFDVEFVFPGLAASSSTTNKAAPAASGGDVGLISSMRGGLVDEMMDYRKKYDDLVTFTVSLTGERDMLLNNLDGLKQELRRELAAARHDGSTSSGSLRHDALALHKRRSSRSSSVRSGSPILGIHSPRTITPTPEQAREAKKNRAPAGYSLLFLTIIGILAFLLGRYSGKWIGW